MSAPGPRSGSSARCGSSGSSPTISRWASVTSVPGSEPIPVAAPVGQGKSGNGSRRPSIVRAPDAATGKTNGFGGAASGFGGAASGFGGAASGFGGLSGGDGGRAEHDV